jgi:hypothetical protein
MYLLDPRIAHLEIDRRLRTAEHHRRVRRARAGAGGTKTPAFSGCGDR